MNTFSLIYHNWLSLKFAIWHKRWALSSLPELFTHFTSDCLWINAKSTWGTVNPGSLLAKTLWDGAPSLLVAAGTKDFLPILFIIILEKRRIETCCPTSWKTVLVARLLCKAGQYQAAGGFRHEWSHLLDFVFWCCHYSSLCLEHD